MRSLGVTATRLSCQRNPAICPCSSRLCPGGRCRRMGSIRCTGVVRTVGMTKRPRIRTGCRKTFCVGNPAKCSGPLVGHRVTLTCPLFGPCWTKQVPGVVQESCESLHWLTSRWS